mgnify:CR=1 FL=1
MPEGSKETVDLKLIEITDRLLSDYYGNDTKVQVDDYAKKFEAIYARLHRAVTDARKGNYEKANHVPSKSAELPSEQ